MGNVIYLLCALTAALCAFLLLRSYYDSQLRLLFWGGLTFVGLTISNLLLIMDKLIFADIDFQSWRLLAGFVALLPLLYGLIWED